MNAKFIYAIKMEIKNIFIQKCKCSFATIEKVTILFLRHIIRTYFFLASRVCFVQYREMCLSLCYKSLYPKENTNFYDV